MRRTQFKSDGESVQTLSSDVEKVLAIAFMNARRRRHGVLTVEMLCFHLLYETTVQEVFNSLNLDVEGLRQDIAQHISIHVPLVAEGIKEVDTQPTFELQNALQRAISEVGDSGPVTGAHVLKAIFAFTESAAVNLLHKHGMDATKFGEPSMLDLMQKAGGRKAGEVNTNDEQSSHLNNRKPHEQPQTCSGCTFWVKRVEGETGWRIGLGRCANVPKFHDVTEPSAGSSDYEDGTEVLKPSHKEVKAFALDTTGHLAELLTKGDFGCTNHSVKTMKTIQFKNVPIGGWFKDSTAGTWHLKTSSTKGAYQHYGSRYEPTYAPTDTVYVE